MNKRAQQCARFFCAENSATLDDLAVPQGVRERRAMGRRRESPRFPPAPSRAAPGKTAAPGKARRTTDRRAAR